MASSRNKRVTAEDFEVIFGGIPKRIEENISYLKCNGNNAICESCNFNISITTSIEENKTVFISHFSSDSHQLIIREKQKLRQILENMFNRVTPPQPLPQIVYVNIFHLYPKGKYSFSCNLCDTRMNIHCYDLPLFEVKCIEHFLSPGHEENVKTFNDTCHQVRIKLENIFGRIPSVIIGNLTFITKDINTYTCRLCNKEWDLLYNPEETKENFKLHFYSPKHKSKAEQERAIINIPELRDMFSNFDSQTSLPIYIIRNIEYISFCNQNFFCSLCNQTVLVQFGRQELHCLKHHFTSASHIYYLYGKRDPKNEVYRKLHHLFESFPVFVRKDIETLVLRDGHFFCYNCKCTIEDESVPTCTDKILRAHFLPGYKNSGIKFSEHRQNLEEFKPNNLQVVKILTKMFGKVPECIESNILYLRWYSENPKFIHCIICEKRMNFNESNSDASESEISKHLYSKFHRENLSKLEDDKERLEELLWEKFTTFIQDHVDNPIPHFITENISNICYRNTSEDVEYNYRNTLINLDDSSSDDEDYLQTSNKRLEGERVSGNNFSCNVCFNHGTPSVILIASDNKPYFIPDKDLANKITEYNFRNHFLSKEHQMKVQRDSYAAAITEQKLNSLFGSIPYSILNSIEYIKRRSHGFWCNLCEERIWRKSDLLQHFENKEFCGYPIHTATEKSHEDSNKLAIETLDARFWRVPEFIIKHVDFLQVLEPNLFCILCQKTIYLDPYDLDECEVELRLHIDSKKHRTSLNWSFIFN